MKAPLNAPKAAVAHPATSTASPKAVSFVDNRASTMQAKVLQEAITNSPRLVAQRQLVETTNNSHRMQQATALQRAIDNSPRQQNTSAPVQKKANTTGLPDSLKAGVENLSGYSLDDVKVHYSSAKPAQLQAHAYAQGAEIHLAPGQEKHLPHEAWHVVQQKQGRVRATMQLKGVGVNDDSALEREADVMGERAMGVGKNQLGNNLNDNKASKSKRVFQAATQLKLKVKDGKEYRSIDGKINAPRLRKLIESSAMYFINSDSEVDNIRDGNNVPVLISKKHLIGEHHSQSNFLNAVRDWGWAASILIEQYSQHQKLKSPLQTERESSTSTDGVYDEKYLHKNAKGLEDAAAKGLSNAVNSKLFGEKLLQFAQKMQNPRLFASLSVAQIQDFCESAFRKMSPLSDVVMMLINYLTKSNQNLFFKDKLHNQVLGTITPDLLIEVNSCINNVREQYLNPSRAFLDPNKIISFLNHADAIIALMRELVVAYDPSGFKGHEIQNMITDTNNTKDIGKMSPLREKYMANNIAHTPAPVLVQIGVNHADSLKGKIADAISYKDYTEFVTENMSDKAST
jgi:hypothetical protein